MEHFDTDDHDIINRMVKLGMSRTLAEAKYRLFKAKENARKTETQVAQIRASAQETLNAANRAVEDADRIHKSVLETEKVMSPDKKNSDVPVWYGAVWVGANAPMCAAIDARAAAAGMSRLEWVQSLVHRELGL